MGDYGFNLSQSTVQELMKAQRRKKQANQIEDTSSQIEGEVDSREKARNDYTAATTAPVKPQKWYQRLAQGAFLGIGSRQPGESLGESVGRGVGFGAASAISSTGHGNIVKNIRNEALTKKYGTDTALSNQRLGDLQMQEGVQNKQYQQGLATDRENRLQQRGIQSFDEAQSKLEMKQKEIEQKGKEFETTSKQRENDFGLRKSKLDLDQKKMEYQQKLGESHLQLDQSKAAEVQRHNKEVEGKGGETDQYIVNLVGSKGEVKPMQIRVPKGEDPEKYVRNIKQAGGTGANGSIITPKGGTSIEQRNKSALDKLKPKTAGESKGLQNLIR